MRLVTKWTAVCAMTLALAFVAGCPHDVPEFRHRGCIEKTNEPPASLVEPRSITFARSPDGQEDALFASDYASNRILALSPHTGRLIAVIGSDCDSLCPLDGPLGIATYYVPLYPTFTTPPPAEFRLYVCDSRNDRIVEFDSTGTARRTWGNYGSGEGQFDVPTGVALDFEGRVYVVDSGNSRVQVFDTTGQFLFAWGSTGSGAGQFYRPVDLTLGFNLDRSTRFVAVSDHGNSRVQVFTPEGQLIRIFHGLHDVRGLGTGYSVRFILAVCSSSKVLYRLDVSDGTSETYPLDESVTPYDVQNGYFISDIGEGTVCIYND